MVACGSYLVCWKLIVFLSNGWLRCSMLALLMEYPKVQQKLHQELVQFANNDTKKKLTSSDVKHLPYLNAVWKELTRMMPTAPVLIPHYTIEDDELDGYFIPKGVSVSRDRYDMSRSAVVKIYLFYVCTESCMG